jgi:hypothetical protein
MAKKLIRKGNGGGISTPTSKSTTKTVSKNPEGTLKTTDKTFTGGNKEGEISRTRRTIKGVLQYKEPSNVIITPKSKTVEKSKSGDYKTVTKTFDNRDKKGTVSTTRRTISGIINNARPVADVKAIKKNRDPDLKVNFDNLKRGGAVKSKTKTKK